MRLLFNLNEITDIRRQLRDTDSRISELSIKTQAADDALLLGLSDLSKNMENEITVVRRRMGSDVSRMGNRLSGRLDDMAERMELAMRGSQSPISVQGSSEPGPTTGSLGPALYEIDTSLQALRVEADTLFEKGRYKEACGKFTLILDRQPADTDLRLKRAVSMFRANPSDTFGYSIIERELKSLLEIQGEIPMALEALGLLATERHQWSESSLYFRRLLAIAPHNASYLTEAGESSLYGGDFSAAKAYVDEALRLFPQDEGAVVLARRLQDASSTGGSH